MQSFLERLETLTHLSPEEKVRIRSGIELVKIKKGTVLQEKGKVNPNAYFVTKGLLRSYTIDEKGREHIYLFGPEGWLVSDMEYDGKNQGVFFIDAIEDSEVEVISGHMIHEFETLLDIGNFREEAERLLKRIGVLQKRVIMLMSASALERYQDFVETYPSIVERVPQRMIASYLGITPEALSKVKGKYLRNS